MPLDLESSTGFALVGADSSSFGLPTPVKGSRMLHGKNLQLDTQIVGNAAIPSKMSVFQKKRNTVQPVTATAMNAPNSATTMSNLANRPFNQGAGNK